MTDINNEQLLKTLLGQHSGIKKIIGKLLVMCDADSMDCALAKNELDFAKTALFEHLALEDSVFYPRVLEKIKSMGADTHKTQKFIDEMKVIGEKVVAFFNSYSSADEIKAAGGKFHAYFKEIAAVLLLRIAAEEEGIFAYLS